MFLSADYRRIARDKLKGNWGLSILVSFVALILGGLSSGGFSNGFASGLQANYRFNSPEELENAIGGSFEGFEEIFSSPYVIWIVGIVFTIMIVSMLVSLVLGSCTELGHDLYYTELCTDGKSSFNTLFSRFTIFFKAIGLRLFISLFVTLWSLLLIVPGIIAGYRYAMAPYLMAQNPNMGIREAVNASKAMMDGRKWRLFCLNFSFIGWSLLAAITLGIGYIWLYPYISAAYAAFYLDASGQGIPLT